MVTQPSAFQPDPEPDVSPPDLADSAEASSAFEDDVQEAYEDHLDTSTRLIRELRDRLRALDPAGQPQPSPASWERVGLLAGIECLLEETRKLVTRLDSTSGQRGRRT